MRGTIDAVFRLFLFGASTFAAFAAAEARPPIVFDWASMDRHRLAGETSIAVPAPAGAPRSHVRVMLTISPEGEVVAAEANPKHNSAGTDVAPALAAARRWKFRPFRYRGEAVTARGPVGIAYRTPGKWRDPAAALPPIDYSNLAIRLERSPCLGSCPAYSVTIDGAGAVVFTTRQPAVDAGPGSSRQFGNDSWVALPGEHRGRIDRKALDVLIERFRAARFFGLEPQYSALVTEGPVYVLSFRSGESSWSVTDFMGELVGMPAVVTELQEAVDNTAGTARWVTGDESSIAALKEEGFDFRSQGAAEYVAFLALTGRGSDALILGLVEAGVSPDRMMVFDSGEAPTPLGESLLLGAIAHHRPKLFAYLARRGWLKRVARERLSEAFAEGGGGCDPAIVRAVVAAGADARTRIRGQEPGGTALTAAVRPNGPCHGVELKPVIEALVAVGVDPNAVNDAGETILYKVEDPDVQERLLAAGPRADVRDKKGNSPAFSSRNDRIVLGLLDAGASPEGRYPDGRSLRQQALERDMPSVLAWLDARGID